jgi:methylenetetrahydrofolate reductase (NADPH)
MATHTNIPSSQHVAECAAELARNASIEFSVPRFAELEEAAETLPRGTSVYLPWPAALPFDAGAAALNRIHTAGFEPVPHLSARGLPSRNALLGFLRRATEECGVRRIMLIGGEQAEPAGPWASAAELLDSGVLRETGIHEVGVAGFPEGHPQLATGQHFADLARKLALAGQQGLGLEVVTQFSFSPLRVTEYCADLARAIPDLPVYAGMAGPATEATLRRYARRCGVSASLRALARLGVRAAHEAAHLQPDEQLAAYAHYCAVRGSANMVGLHVYSFGGFTGTAQWLRKQFTPATRTPDRSESGESTAAV